jgi:hypothetical protein
MIEQLWSTPFMKTRMDENLVETITEKIFLNYNLRDPNKIVSNFNGNIFDDESAEIINLEKFMYKMFDSFLHETLNKKMSDWKSYKFYGWLTSSNKGYSLSHHNHKGSQLSAVLYFLCETDINGGKVIFTDPRSNANRGFDNQFNQWFEPLIITPKTGDVVIFPSYLYHFVETYDGNIRLAMPIDCFLYTNE